MTNDLQYKYILRFNDNVLQVRISKNLQEHRYRWDTIRHCNAEYEIHILLKGRIPVEVEESLFFIEVGQGLLILPGKYHAPQNSSDALEHFSIGFSVLEGGLADILHNEIQNCKPFSITTDMLQECLEIYREFNTYNIYRNEKISALLSSIMISVLRNLNLSKLNSTVFSITELERTDLIDAFFALSLKEPLKAEQLAKQLHLSERQLNRVIQQLYGMTFQEKLTQTRMDRAAWLLRTTNKKIGEIADLIGYSSEAAFYQAFQKYFQITPKKYRMQKK